MIVFALLPFFGYLIINRIAKGFFLYTGLHKTTYSAMIIAALAGLVIGAAGIAIMYSCPGIRQTADGQGTVPEQIRQLTSPAGRMLLILIIAFIKTALAEEILFRGLLPKN